jgi:hypothetical protein
MLMADLDHWRRRALAGRRQPIPSRENARHGLLVARWRVCVDVGPAVVFGGLAILRASSSVG